MIVVRSAAEMKNLSLTLQKGGESVGLVPTMGALHEGHLSLIEIAKKNCDTVVVSIFVNPSQFGPNEDLEKYPRPFDDDCRKAQDAGAEIVFAPSALEMYPNGYSTYIDVHGITDVLCGKSRIGHFKGVATVVFKLFNIVAPHIAVFGQKDAQQLLVIKKMVKDLNSSVRIITAPIFREPDGLAMSSRNAYLTSSERSDSTLISKSLQTAVASYTSGEKESQKLKNQIVSILNSSTLFTIEYVEIVDTINLNPVDTVTVPALLAIACKTKESSTRLIDNAILGGGV